MKRLSTEYGQSSKLVRWLPLFLVVMCGFIFQPVSILAVDKCGGIESSDCQCDVSNPFPCDKGNCTWWAWHKVCCTWGNEAASEIANWTIPRDAHTWNDKAMNSSIFTVSDTPAPQTIAVQEANPDNDNWGHVAWVESVNGNEITVTEMMWKVAFSGGYRTKTYNASDFDGGFISYDAQQGDALLSEDPTVSPSPVILGQEFTVSFTLEEIQGAPVTFDAISVEILDADDNLVFVFANYENETIPANGTLSKSGTNFLYDTHSTGTYKVAIRGKIGRDWFDFDTGNSTVNPKEFTVKREGYVSVSGGIVVSPNPVIL